MQTVVTVVVLVGVGALGASWWMEWRHVDLETPAQSFEGVPGAQGTGSPYSMDDRVSVEVLNGAGDPGAAAAYADRLRGMGFDVKTFGNAASFDQVETVVIDRSGRGDAATAVADSLGLDSAREELARDLYLDATVVLGRDWREVLDRLD